MTITSREYSDLINYFSIQNATNHIISLALTVNDSSSFKAAASTSVITIPLDQSWDILDTVDNNTTNSSSSLSSLSSASTLFSQYISDNSSSQFATNDTVGNQTVSIIRPRTGTEIPIWLIPCYSIILIFAIVGNLLVASTLFQNRRMRTITNVFLANLAISDMLLGVLCMPITLVGTYLRHFIFGELVCKFIQFAQAASVAVSSWTLVAISCERYYAICHPLRSRTWQTINHAYKIIGCIWFGSIICMAPIAIFSQLIPTSRQGLRKCREQWPQQAVGYERSYNIFLDLILLVLPLAILCVAYILITRTLYLGIKDEKALIYGNKNNNVVTGVGSGGGGGGGGTATGGSATHPNAGDGGKIYNQVEADMKTTNAFNLNVSFRYQTRKGGGCVGAGSGGRGLQSSGSGGLINNTDEMLQIVQSASSNGKETKFLTNAGRNNKYLASSTLGESISHPRILCSNTSIQTEIEVAFKDAKETNTEIQQPLNDKTYSASTSSSIQHFYDDITQMGVNTTTGTTDTTTSINPLNNKRAIVAKTTDGRRQQLYCMRSASVKSFNRSSRTSAESEDTTSSSCHSLNTLSTKFQRQLKPQQQYHSVFRQTQYHQQIPQPDTMEKRKLNSSPSLRITESALRRSNLEKNLESKKRVVKMLFVLVLEFFICWTPLYVINTVAMFIGPAIYEYVDYTTISFFQLLAYSSSCCNPITYCFMNASFRRAFVDTFRGIHLNGGTFWHKSSKTATNLSMAGNSIAMGNSCTVVTANTVLDSPRL